MSRTPILKGIYQSFYYFFGIKIYAETSAKYVVNISLINVSEKYLIYILIKVFVRASTRFCCIKMYAEMAEKSGIKH